VRRDTGESYDDFLTKLAQASGIKTPTRADLARLDALPIRFTLC
jgi:transposase